MEIPVEERKEVNFSGFQHFFKACLLPLSGPFEQQFIPVWQLFGWGRGNSDSL